MSIDQRLSPGAHSLVTPSGATLTYFVHGTGPLTIVNTAPGWGCASVLYQNSFTFLNDAFTFVHLELRGTRGSSFPEDLSLMSSWHMSEDIEALRVHLGIDVLDGLFGHSNGGAIALWYAIRYVTRLRRLVLLDSQLLGPDADAVGAPATDAILADRSERDAVAAYKTYNPAAIDTDEAFGRALDDTLPLYFAKPARDMQHFKDRTNEVLAPDDHECQRTYFGQLTDLVRVLLLRGPLGLDARSLGSICEDVIPVSEMLATRIAGGKLAIVDDSGHFPWIEQQERFASIVKSFFREQ
ncbi:alpha/beta-hydrolase [Exidia glandulosa HHB12029]|uniref:Alpha/beta-hydrolase n=1 Tax=Exidia glandulosa HHB12029 TaxID=1314781 RepID=A0A165GY76_EXIGL|nr:alpha/beta-hydrolase [Exidia glandulosa HHB12029]